MAITSWVYRLSDGMFLRGGYFWPEHNPATEGVTEFVEYHPDMVLERYDESSPTKRRLATAQELADAESARADAEAVRCIDEQRAVKAAVLTGLWGRLGRQPTAQEIAAERTRFIAIYKSLS